MATRDERRIQALFAAAAFAYVGLAVFVTAVPDPNRFDLAAEALVDRLDPDASYQWGDEPHELLLDYTLFALAHGAIVIAAWKLGKPRHAYAAILAVLGQEATIRLTKGLIERARPEEAHSATNAYPSGHVAQVGLAILLFLFLILPLMRGLPVGTLPARRDAAFAAASIALFALYRVFSGEHWITDVVGGAALATAASTAAVVGLAATRTEKP